MIWLQSPISVSDLRLQSGMDTVDPQSQGPDWSSSALSARVSACDGDAGYFLSGVSGGRDVRPVAQSRVGAALSRPPPEIQTLTSKTIWTRQRSVGSLRVPADLVAAVIEAESDNNPRAVSRRGARGLMQLMPKTARTLGVRDPFDPRANIDAGVRHLRALMDRFGSNNLPLVLAAYNAGEVAVIKHRGVPPYRETRAYVKRILKKLDRRTASL